MFLLSIWERAVWSAIEIASSVDVLGQYANWSGSRVSEMMVLMLATKLILTTTNYNCNISYVLQIRNISYIL